MKILKTLIAPLIAAILAGSTAFAQQVPQIAPPAGFSEGTETKLTDVQIVDLVPWAKNSKRDLEELLLDADTIGSPVTKKQVLLKGIQNLVLQSQPLKSELLMRYVLNRALVVNTEIENEAIAPNGGKAPTGIVDQQIRLLTLSAKMAVKYFESDLAFLNGAVTKKDVNLVTLPYAKFGLEYAEFLMNLNNSITDASAQYNIGVIALGLLQWDLYRDQNKVAFADSITKINSFLKTLPECAGLQDDNTSETYVRLIKRKFKTVGESIRQRGSELGVAFSVVQSTLSGQATKINKPESEINKCASMLTTKSRFSGYFQNAVPFCTNYSADQVSCAIDLGSKLRFSGYINDAFSFCAKYTATQIACAVDLGSKLRFSGYINDAFSYCNDK
ncbi:MAG: hypothetical protein HYW49_10180 [Deltaproteobacteria bacterium]|nr:hypothetical protein [Deltaproteobacteria bacterium]